MNFRIISVLAIFGMLNLTSCMQDHPSPSDVQKEIKVSASIEGVTNVGVKTRVTGDSWNDGDAIGIFMMKSGTTLSTASLAVNAKYATNGTGNFFPTTSNGIYFPFNEDEVDFIAYYPHTNSLDGLNYPVDVSDQSNLSDIDLLYSYNEKGVNASKGITELIFTHQLSNVILNISEEEGVPGKDLSNLKAEITNVNTKASLSLVDGSLSDGSDPKSVSLKMSTDGKYGQAILLPTNLLNNISLKLKIDTTIFIYKLTDATNIKTFEKSKKYTFKFALKSGDVTLIENVTATIEDWIDGGTEHITIYEGSTSNPSGGNGEGEDAEGNGEGEETGDGNNLQEGGGTEENPYTVEQVKTMSPKKNVWVKGYIVGMYTAWTKSSFITENFENATTLASNIAIATSSTETDFIKTFRIDFRDSYTLGKTILLDANPNNFGKKAHFQGVIIDNPQKKVGEETVFGKIKKTIIFED